MNFRFSFFLLLLISVVYWGCRKDSAAPKNTSPPENAVPYPIDSFVGIYHFYGTYQLSIAGPNPTQSVDSVNEYDTILKLADTSIVFQGLVYSCPSNTSKTVKSFVFIIPNAIGGDWSLTFPNPFNDTVYYYSNYAEGFVETYEYNLVGVKVK